MISIAALCLITNTSLAAFEYRNNSPAHLFPYTVAAIDESCPGALYVPAYLPYIKSPYIHYAGTKVYSMNDLYAHTLGLGGSFSRIGLSATWNYFGLHEYQENLATFGIGIRTCDYLYIGAGASYAHLRIRLPELCFKQGYFNFSGSLVVIPLKWIRMSFIYDNLASLINKRGKDFNLPAWSCGITLKPFDGFSLIWNASKTPTGIVHSFAATVNPLKYISFSAGYGKETTTFITSISVIYKNISASYALRYHPHLGLTHCAGLTLSVFDHYPSPIPYRNLSDNDLPATSAIDINKCSDEDITFIPGLEPLFAERIIKYRKNIGPLSHDSLEEIGMDRKAISHLMRYTMGYIAKTPKTDPTILFKTEKNKKKLFQKLMNLGIAPHSALTLSEIAARKDFTALKRTINEMENLSPQIKKKIYGLCEKAY